MSRRVGLLPNIVGKVNMAQAALDKLSDKERERLGPIIAPFLEWAREQDEFNRKIRDAANDTAEDASAAAGGTDDAGVFAWFMEG